MEKLSFKVLNSAFLTLIQDSGRFSYSHLGVTNSGFMDEYAAFACNKLLDNDIKGNLLEISFPNLHLEATKDTTLALTGAFCELFINDEQKNTWCSHQVKKGDSIRIGSFKSGQRVYLGVKNGFILKKEFGSFSTTLKEGFGKILEKNSILDFEEFKGIKTKKWHKNYLPQYGNDLTLRVILSYQEDTFSNEAKELFFNNKYKITSDFNRMACKLDGKEIKSNINGVISEAISYGSIQIPNDGKPIILLKEAQTIGGYPKIGSVLSVDCFKLAQMKIGGIVNFKEISINQAQEKLKKFYSTFLS